MTVLSSLAQESPATPVRNARASGFVLGAALALSTILVPVAVLAQAAPRPAPPAPQAPPQQSQPAAAAGAGPSIVQVKPEPSQTEWTKVCGKDPGNNKEICYTTRDFVSDQGQPVLAVAVYEVKGDANKIVRFLMPLGLMLQPGVRFGVDQAQPTAGRYAICFPNGCFAEATVKDDVINAMKRGTTLSVSVQNQGTREVTFAIPVAGFGKAYDGAPIDPKVLEEQQKKLQDAMEKQQDELRKRLGGDAPAAPKP